jgi:hypothetical protein
MQPDTEIAMKLTAWVDEAVVPLVLALDELNEGVVTLESRRGGPGRYACVVFKRRAGENIALARRIADALRGHDHEVHCELRAAWRAGDADPVLEIACPDAHVMPLALILRADAHGRRRPPRDGRVGRSASAASPARRRPLASV